MQWYSVSLFTPNDMSQYDIGLLLFDIYRWRNWGMKGNLPSIVQLVSDTAQIQVNR